MAMLEKLLNGLDRVASVAARSLVVLIVVILGAQIFARFVLNQSLIWSEEVATWSMVWVVYLGSAVLMRCNEHVGIPIFVRLLPLPLRVVAIFLGRIATVACVLFITWYGVQVVLSTFSIISESTGVDTRWIKLCIPIGSGLMAIFALANLGEDLVHLRRYGLQGFINRPTNDLAFRTREGEELV